MTLKTSPAKTAAFALSGIAVALAMTSSAHAALSLTQAGIDDHFTLSTFYSDPVVNYGMLGMTNTSDGHIIGTGYARGQLALFANTDGQTPGSALTTAAAVGTPTSIATVSGHTYVNQLGGGYFEVNTTTLAETGLARDDNFAAGYGLWANQSTGHLLASGLSNGIYDIDPTTGHVRTVTSGVFYDGVSISPDGAIVYGAGNGGIYGFNILTGAQVLAVDGQGRGPDGTGVISGGALNGFIIVNNNDGTVGLIDPTSTMQTIIATGGSRGDLVGPDASTGTLFLSSYEQVYRLGVEGGAIGGGPGVPEPSTWAMMLLGFGGLGSVIRRRRARLAVV